MKIIKMVWNFYLYSLIGAVIVGFIAGQVIAVNGSTTVGVSADRYISKIVNRFTKGPDENRTSVRIY